MVSSAASSRASASKCTSRPKTGQARRSADHPRRAKLSGHRPRGPGRLRQGDGRHRQAVEARMHEHDHDNLAHRPVSEIRRWCERPPGGRRRAACRRSRFRVGGGGQGRAPDAGMARRARQHGRPRGRTSARSGASVQSGKTAGLIAAALYHFSRHRSPFFVYEPDDRLKRVLAARIVAWGRLCDDEAVQGAYMPKRPPFVPPDGQRGGVWRSFPHEGGRRRASCGRPKSSIVDELRVFHVDHARRAGGPHGVLRRARPPDYRKLGGLTRMSVGPRPSWTSPTRADGSCAARRATARTSRTGRTSSTRAATIPPTSCRAAVPSWGACAFRQAVAAGRWQPTKAPLVPGTIGYHARRLPVAVRVARDHRPPVEARRRSPKTDWFDGGDHRVPVRAPGCSRSSRLAAHGRDSPEGIAASSCREDYDPAVVPAGASVVVAAADTQDNRR